MANYNRKLSERQRERIRQRLRAGERPLALAEEYGVSDSLIYIVGAGVPRPEFRGRRHKFSIAQRNEIAKRLRGGERSNALAAELGVNVRTIRKLRPTVARMRNQVKARKRSALRLSIRDREEISRGIEARESASGIARRLRRARSTISREIQRAGGRHAYRAWVAEDLFLERGRRPKASKLASNPALRGLVEEGLKNFWSPQQISRQLRHDYRDNVTMQVSHETIYQSLFVQGRGALRADLTKYLRTRRKGRRSQGVTSDRGRIKDMVSIRERPAEAEDRAVPGHWEGDLLLGRGGKSAIATLVERRSRFVMLVALPNGRTAAEVADALAQKIRTLPDELRKSLTWDQGKEMAHHVRFTIDTGVKVYFCDPHSPWQRGSNENTNGLLRQFLPRTTDLRRVSQRDLDRIADLMNGRPRQTLDWEKPCHYLRRAVAMTG